MKNYEELYVSNEGIINPSGEQKTNTEVGVSNNATDQVQGDVAPSLFGGSNMITILGVYAVVIVGFMMFVSKPQKKKRLIVEKMQNELSAGDEVYTSSGFYGKVISTTEDKVNIEFGINKGVCIPVNRKDVFKTI